MRWACYIAIYLAIYGHALPYCRQWRAIILIIMVIMVVVTGASLPDHAKHQPLVNSSRATEIPPVPCLDRASTSELHVELYSLAPCFYFTSYLLYLINCSYAMKSMVCLALPVIIHSINYIESAYTSLNANKGTNLDEGKSG